MNWLNRIWSKIWVEQSSTARKSSDDILKPSDPVDKTNNGFVLNTDFFHVSLSEEWVRTEGLHQDQFCFRHKGSDIDFILSCIVVDMPPDKLMEAAKVLLDSTVEGMKEHDRNLKIIQSEDFITEQSWGFQASVIRVYEKPYIYRFFGFVSSKMILNVTFESEKIGPSFDIEVETVLASFRMEDSVWGDRQFLEGSQIQ